MILLPANEIRKFHYGILPNKMKYTIIQDASDINLNVSLCVNVGSLMDPREYMGLAHFLEHMLFLGSEKYPDENYFSKNIKSNGGNSNAYTGLYETVYYFNCINNMENILDIFSRFFIDPLFNIDSVEREINAINSEHMKNINNDMWATRQIMYNLTKKDCIINRFTTGNFDTLKNTSFKKLRNSMIEFYKKYYTSNNMYLTVISNQNIDIIEKYIKTFFSSILPNNMMNKLSHITKNNITKNNKYYENKYEIVMIPNNINTNILYFWEVPTSSYFLYNKAIYVISYMIEYNSKDNLKNILKREGLATSIYCNYLDEGLFVLNITLTETNDINSHIIKINNMVSKYMNYFLQKQVDWKKFYNYYSDIMNINYMYGNKIDNNNLANIISVNMVYYNSENIYNGNMIVIKKEMDKLILTLNMLKFEKSNIIYLTNKKLKMSKTFIDKYYNTKYGTINSSLKINNNSINNNNINYKYDLTSYHTIINKFNKNKPIVLFNLDKYNIPTMIEKNNWYGASDKFNETTVFGFYYIENKKWVSNVKNYMITLISINLLNQYINMKYNIMSDIGYNAYFSICNITGYIIFTITGYNNMYNDFLKNIKDTIHTIILEPIMVNNMIDKFIQNLKSINKISPWDYSAYILDLIQFKYFYNNDDKIRILYELLKGDTINILYNRIKSIIRIFNLNINDKISITSLIYGNINKKDVKYLNSYYNSSRISKPKLLTSTSFILPNKNDKNKLIMMMLPCGKFKSSRMAIIILLNMIMEEPVFHQLRTIEQLGYLVSCSIYNNSYNYYIMIKVQSILDIDIVEKKMNNFILYITKYLTKLDNDIFNNIKKAAVKILLQEPCSMIEHIDKYINEIKFKKYKFDKNIIIANYINMISMMKISNLYSKIIKNIITIKII